MRNTNGMEAHFEKAHIRFSDMMDQVVSDERAESCHENHHCNYRRMFSHCLTGTSDVMPGRDAILQRKEEAQMVVTPEFLDEFRKDFNQAMDALREKYYYVLTQDVDLNSLHLQYEEVQTVRWATLDEILQMIDDGRFIPYEKSQIELLFFRRNHRSSHTRSDPTND